MSALANLGQFDSPDTETILPLSNLESDEPPLESDLHLLQIKRLLDSLNWLWQERQNYFTRGVR